MSKTYREFVAEVAKSTVPDEINFLNKHITILIDYPIDVEDQFTGGDISKFTRLADYKPGQDAAVYENAVVKKEIELTNLGKDLDSTDCTNNTITGVKKQEIIKKIIDESTLTDDLKEEYSEVLNNLSETNIQFALNNNIDLLEFANKLLS